MSVITKGKSTRNNMKPTQGENLNLTLITIKQAIPHTKEGSYDMITKYQTTPQKNDQLRWISQFI